MFCWTAGILFTQAGWLMENWVPAGIFRLSIATVSLGFRKKVSSEKHSWRCAGIMVHLKVLIKVTQYDRLNLPGA